MIVIFVLVVSSIPRIVCEVLHSLQLDESAPVWKVMDSHGKITVVLHWDQRPVGAPPLKELSPDSRGPGPPPKPSRIVVHGKGENQLHHGHSSPQHVALATSTTVSNEGKKETLINNVPRGGSAGGRHQSNLGPHPAGGHPFTHGPQITVIDHDDDMGHELKFAHSHRSPGLSRQGSSVESTGTVHIHTPECCAYGSHVHIARGGSPNEVTECDFHCCALHETGGKIHINKSVATSPIQDSELRRSINKGAHVRFLDAEPGSEHQDGDVESSESDNETTFEDSKTEKFLLLMDHLSIEQKRHLTIKDIGLILERLSSKIVDVEKLDRERESTDCYNWTIKATIRGDDLQDLGVVYNGNYYALSEHPGYKDSSNGTCKDPE